MQKFKFSVLVALIAIVGSAFINLKNVNAEEVNGEKARRFTVIYYHICGRYDSTIPAGTCGGSSLLSCRITYSTSQGTSFPDNAIPPGGTLSADKGCYNAPWKNIKINLT